MTEHTPKEFQALLAESGKRLDRRMVSTMSRAAGNIKRDWRAQAATKNTNYARKYPGSIIMRRTLIKDGVVTVVVEPRWGKRGQGNLGPILEHGGRHNRPQHSNQQALDRELPNVLHWLTKLATEAITKP